MFCASRKVIGRFAEPDCDTACACSEVATAARAAVSNADDRRDGRDRRLDTIASEFWTGAGILVPVHIVRQGRHCCRADSTEFIPMPLRPATKTATLARIHPKTRVGWRAWLEKNHRTSPGVWLLFYKQASGKRRLHYGDAVEEALCFGWIDSTVK